MTTSLTIDFNQPVPVFPLPGCVLLPNATIPLHFFEPRYVQMVADALAGRRLIATAMFKGEAWKTDYQASPPIRPCVCVGYILEQNHLPDGRYNVLLQGLCRAQVVEETPGIPGASAHSDKLYRQAMLRPTDITGGLEIDLADERQRIDALLADELINELTAIHAIHKWLTTDVPTSTLVDLGTMTLCEESQTRYDMLQQPDPTTRACQFIHMLQDTCQLLKMARRLAPPELTDHMNIN